MKETHTPLKIIILAAGKSSRMKSALSKVLHPLGGRPVLHYVLETAFSLDPQEVVVVVSPDIKDLQTPWPIKIAVQEIPQGTGDAVKAGFSALSSSEGDILILYGDTPFITSSTLIKSRDVLHHPRTGVIFLGMYPENSGTYGRLVATPEGVLQKIVEYKDASSEERQISFCNSGVVWAKGPFLTSSLEKLHPSAQTGEYYVTDLVPLAAQENLEARVVEGTEGEFLGINTRGDLAEAEALLQQRWRQEALEEGVTLINPDTVYFTHDTQIQPDVTVHPFVFFGPGVKVKENAAILPFCRLEGTVLEKGAVVGPFTHMRAGTIVGEGAHIGNFVETKNAHFEENVMAKHLSYIGDAFIGARANVGAGTITCNYDGKNKARTCIEKGAFIGSNTALVAPVTVGEGAIVGAGSVITKDVNPQALALARGQQRNVEGGAVRYRERVWKK